MEDSAQRFIIRLAIAENASLNKCTPLTVLEACLDSAIGALLFMTNSKTDKECKEILDKINQCFNKSFFESRAQKYTITNPPPTDAELFKSN